MPGNTERRVLQLSMAAVLVSTAILAALQYRSLAQLKARTEASLENGMARLTQDASRHLVSQLGAIASDALEGFRFSDAKLPVNDLAARFQEVRRRRAGIQDVFISALDGSSATFSTAFGAQRFT